MRSAKDQISLLENWETEFEKRFEENINKDIRDYSIIAIIARNLSNVKQRIADIKLGMENK